MGLSVPKNAVAKRSQYHSTITKFSLSQRHRLTKKLDYRASKHAGPHIKAIFKAHIIILNLKEEIHECCHRFEASM